MVWYGAPLCYIVLTVVTGLNDATSKQPANAQSLVSVCRSAQKTTTATAP